MKIDKKTLLALIIGLVVINLGLLGFIYTGSFEEEREKDHADFRFGEFVQVELGFDSSQMKEFAEIQKNFQLNLSLQQKRMKKFKKEMRKAKKANNKEAQLTAKAKLADAKKMIKSAFETRNNAVRNLCDDDQLEWLEQFLNEKSERKKKNN